MTQIFEESKLPIRYPTPWEPLLEEEESVVKFRSLDEHRYEIRSATHYITVDSEGLRLFKDESIQGQVLYTNWCERNSVTPTPREDVTDANT